MGGMIGEGAVIDRQFNTIDVCLVLPTARGPGPLPAPLPAAPAAGRRGRLSAWSASAPGCRPRRRAPAFLTGSCSFPLRRSPAPSGSGAFRRAPPLVPRYVLAPGRSASRSAAPPSTNARPSSSRTMSPTSTSWRWVRHRRHLHRQVRGGWLAALRLLARRVGTFFIRRHWRQALIQRNELAGADERRRELHPVRRGHQQQRPVDPAVQDLLCSRRRALGAGLPGGGPGCHAGLPSVSPTGRRSPPTTAISTPGTATRRSCRIFGRC